MRIWLAIGAVMLMEAAVPAAWVAALRRPAIQRAPQASPWRVGRARFRRQPSSGAIESLRVEPWGGLHFLHRYDCAREGRSALGNRPPAPRGLDMRTGRDGALGKRPSSNRYRPRRLACRLGRPCPCPALDPVARPRRAVVERINLAG
jgi:hypothetical protein